MLNRRDREGAYPFLALALLVWLPLTAWLLRLLWRSGEPWLGAAAFSDLAADAASAHSPAGLNRRRARAGLSMEPGERSTLRLTDSYCYPHRAYF